MHDLRARFGFILAVALLPLLIFSIWHSIQDFRNEADARRFALVKASRDVVVDIIDLVDDAKVLERSFDGVLTDENCRPQINKFLREFQQFSQVVVYKGSGAVQCTVKPQKAAAYQGDLNLFTLKHPYVIQTQKARTEDDRIEDMLVISYGVFNQGELSEIYSISVPLTQLRALRDDTRLPSGAHAVLINRRGDILVGHEGFSGRLEDAWVNAAAEREIFEIRTRDDQNGSRDILIRSTGEPELFIAVSRPALTLVSLGRLNSLSSIIIPLFAWLFAFMAIWLATNQMMIVHLRKMRGAALNFARGHYDVRLDTMDDAPEQIQELANTFDIMAERISKRDARLNASLEEKETLLREIHHRVKNNLQIIISLFNMQERRLKDPAALAAIAESRNRVNAIALVHKSLYESDDLGSVPMDRFLNHLVGQLSKALLADQKKIRVETDVQCDPLDADRATPVALFIVEALTNAVKHGVADGGNVFVSMSCDEDNMTVIVRDTGKNAKEDFFEGTGNKLMTGFARQLGGKYARQISDDGYSAILTFPLIA